MKYILLGKSLLPAVAILKDDLDILRDLDRGLIEWAPGRLWDTGLPFVSGDLQTIERGKVRIEGNFLLLKKGPEEPHTILVN